MMTETQLDPNRFREGMSRLFAAVNVITIRDNDQIMGTTATAVCSVSDSPPALLVCLHKQGKVHAGLRAGTPLSVNTLAEGQDPVAQVFAGAGGLSMPERFATGDWDTSGTAAPVLRGSAVSFKTHVHELIESGSHSIVVCRIDDIVLGNAPGVLMYGSRQYHAVPTGG